MKLFDLDGTLIDSNGIWEEIDLRFLSERGLEATPEYAHTVGHSIFPIAAQFTKDYYHLDMTPQAIMDAWLSGARAAYAQVPMKAGAMEFLHRCRAQGERMAVVTACVPELCRAALRYHGLEDWFEAVIFAQDMGLEKRDPEVFRRAAAMLGVPPEACTLYEDAPANCAAAKRVGMTVVGVYDKFYAAYQEEMRRDCHGYIVSFTELLE